MQYILTEDEMAAIRAERNDAQKMPSLEALTNVVRHVACSMVEVAGNLPNGRRPTDAPRGCIHVKDSAWAMVKEDQRTDDPPVKRYFTPPYCDRCAVAGICPQPKEWSK